MKEHGIHGNIINVTSSRGERAYPNAGLYCGMKAGLNKSIEAFALDVAFLASDKASYITGITLRIDGGLILPGMPEGSPASDHGWG